MTFKQVTISDLKTILSMLKSASEELSQKGVEQWSYWQSPPKEKIEWLKQGLLNNEFFFVYYKNQQVGMFRLLYKDELYWGKQNNPAGYIHSLVIKSDYKGQEFGSKIIERVQKELIYKKIELMRLDCVSHNKRLCGYYEKLGFKKVGVVQMPLSLNNLYEKKIG